ncbi:elongation factor P maturation arginine rhamnosyltransferase EarP [Paraburkholderia sp. SARCC-3016]|uniref:elongation factor P maturation arginine rhamnosyltransferase EarP n=1 Tax=Paraburkholderia sp. SARCC-3016 TaxID=3058611 RepID=UPI0028068C03|nr:elongation factor P maturation arginine rhamnosyltransferase EarP [Paraburkholderia sp. SARCC-3016]MDQ7979756.1 elongation factor P maturation arginine rhamnosyltransferase EarP [Paraburkholderia sp. SARCC-3016]
MPHGSRSQQPPPSSAHGDTQAAPAGARNATVACDIFCAVIDNFGDIGVCWRLARQLAAEHGWQVRVFVDDLRAFHALCPAVETDRARQTVQGIVVEHWHEPAHAGDTLEVADVVIEAFACELPPVYVAAMARRASAPVWINLEYLSAEDWVADFHLRPSPHPRYPLVKTFFFPGLAPGTGGVLKERDLDAQRAAFEASETTRAQWWRETAGTPPPAAGATVISLFAYENPAVDALLEQWRDARAPVVLLVPEGRISGALARFFGLPSFAAGTHATRGSLTAHALAFTEQPGYDRLLWASDLNFVRGEDSFVRAQWAARPFVWHIYPQADDAHLPKLDAALAHYVGSAPRCAPDEQIHALPAAARDALTRFWHAWNGVGAADWGTLWADFARHLPALTARAEQWARELARAGDLAGNLAEYAKSQLK